MSIVWQPAGAAGSVGGVGTGTPGRAGAPLTGDRSTSTTRACAVGCDATVRSHQPVVRSRLGFTRSGRRTGTRNREDAGGTASRTPGSRAPLGSGRPCAWVTIAQDRARRRSLSTGLRSPWGRRETDRQTRRACFDAPFGWPVISLRSHRSFTHWRGEARPGRTSRWLKGRHPSGRRS